MSDQSEPELAAVFDFVNDYLDDVESDRVRPLSYYLTRYPGFDEAIAREYLRLTTDDNAPTSPGDGESDGKGRDRIGPYRLIQELGSGGQATVYLAEDSRIERRVALKLLRGGFVTEERRNRFRREAEIISRLDHPGICAIHEAEIDGETPYIAMRFIDGQVMGASIELTRALGDLATKTRDEAPGAVPWFPRNRADLHRVLYVFERAARAMHAAHEAGVIHRDLKPGNIAITADGDPVILDFGLAQDDRSDAEGLTRSGDIFGTPAYMSPEQLRGMHDELDARTDVYSLGITLFEALVSRRPFEFERRFELERAILYDPIPDPRTLNTAVSEDVRVVLETALEKDRDRRYATALELAEDLRRIREFEPIRARPAGPLLRLSRWARRQPALATAILGTFVALTTGLIGALVLLDQKERALEAATGRHLATRSAELVEEEPTTALALAVEACRLAPSYLTRSALFAPLHACRLEHLIRLPTVHRIWDLRLDPDGERAVAALDDGTARVWDVDSGRELFSLPCGSEKVVVRRVAFDADGERLVTATKTGRVDLWDGSDGTRIGGFEVAPDVLWVELDPTGKRLVVLTADAPAQVRSTDSFEVVAELDVEPLSAGSARFNHDGTRILTASLVLQSDPLTSSNVATVWNATTGERVVELEGHAAPICYSEWDLHGRHVVTASQDGTARLWNAETGEPARAPIQLDGPVYCARLSADGALLVATTFQGDGSKACLVELESGRRTTLTDTSSGGIASASFSPDGRSVATASYDRTVRIYDVATGEERFAFCDRFQQLGAFWTGDSRRLVSLSRSATVQIWRVGELPYVFTLPGHGGGVSWTAFTPDGDHALTACADGLIRQFYAPAGEGDGARDPGELVRSVIAHAGPVVGATLSADGTRVMTYSSETVGLFRLEDLERIAETPRHERPIVAADCSPESDRVVTVDEAGALWFHDLEQGGATRRVLADVDGLRRARYSEDGRWFAAAGTENAVWILDGETADVIRRIEFTPERANRPGVVDLAFRPSSTELAVAPDGAPARLYDPESGAVLRHAPGSFRPHALGFGPGGDRLWVRGGGPASISVYDLVRDVDVRPGISQSDLITCAAISADGAFALAGSKDGSVLVWSTVGGELAVHNTEGRSPVRSAAFSPVAGDQRIVAGFADGTVTVWPVDPLPVALARRPRELAEWELERELQAARSGGD